MAMSRALGLASLASAVALHGVSASSAPRPLLDDTPQAPLTTAKKPLVETEALQGSIAIDRLLKSAQELYEFATLSSHEYSHPTRVIGSQGHLATLDYIHDSISELGDYYEIIEQPFLAHVGWVHGYRLVVGNKLLESAQPMSLTPPTKDREPVRGHLILVGGHGCSPRNYPSSVNGNVAFIRRGACSPGDKSALAGKAGAIAAVIYNDEKGEIFWTLDTPDPNHVATFGIPLEHAKPVLTRLESKETVDSIAYISSWVNSTITKNIVIQTVDGDPNNCVALGAHSDSVEAGPGINDDGSGALSLLEVARQLTKFRVNNCVRFAWWSAEEEGMVGSSYYASNLSPEENLRIRLYMNYDMLASPNFAYHVFNGTNDVHPVGSEELRDHYVDWYEAHNLNYTLVPFNGRSDYDGFIRAGIPAGGINTGSDATKSKEEAKLFGGRAGEVYDQCYHQLCDDTGNLNVIAWEMNTKLVAHSVATYAASLKGVPKRDADIWMP